MLENGNPAPLRNFISQWISGENKPGIRTVIEVPVREEEVIRFVLSGENAFNENASTNEPGSPANQPLISALANVLHYFFIHQSLPVRIGSQTSVPAGLFAKTSLLLLARMSESETEKLLARFYKHPDARQWLESRFSEFNYKEKQILQFLNRLMIRESPVAVLQPKTDDSLPIRITDTGVYHRPRNIAEQTYPLPDPLPDIPLWQRFYDQETIAPEQRKRKMMQLLSHFLTWQSLPHTTISAGEIPADQVLKEILFFLFATDRAALQTLLGQASILPEAVIRIAGLFKTGKGGAEQRLVIFLQPALWIAMVDALWDEGSRKRNFQKPKETKMPVDMLTRLTSIGNDSGNGTAEQQAAQWLDFFLSRNKLPAELATAYPSATREAVLPLALYLSGKNRELLKQIFQKDSHHPAARMRLHEWIQKKEGSRGRELGKLAEAVLQKDVLAYLCNTTGGLPGAVNSLQAVWNSTLAVDKKKEILAAVAKYGEAREEWVKAVSTRDLYFALKETFPSEPKPYSYLVDTVTNLLNPVLQAGNERESVTLHNKVFLLMILTDRVSIDSPADFISRFFLYLDTRKPSFTSGLYQKLQQSWQHREPMPGEDPLVTKELQKAIASRLPLTSVPAKKKESQAGSVKGKPATPAAKPAGKLHLPEPDKQQPVIEPGTKLYVNNAGLVLLHPFIPTYFTLTGLTEKGEFINKEAQRRAVLLLQYMAFGTTEFEEPALVLNKVLCGLPIEKPVPSVIQPTEKEKQVTEELFTIVFQRWARMKNATMDGFRHSFLQREGALVKGEAKWAMRVEPRGYDAILPTMPWAFGFVKLP